MGLEDRVIADSKIIEDTESDTTYSFPLRGRTEWLKIMKMVGYVEIPEFASSDFSTGYFCGSCSYLIRKKDSITGYWCNKFEFPDRPEGCCGGYEYVNSAD